MNRCKISFELEYEQGAGSVDIDLDIIGDYIEHTVQSNIDHDQGVTNPDSCLDSPTLLTMCRFKIQEVDE